MIADLRGKGGHIRTVAVPVWVKQAINAWQSAAGIEEGPLLRSANKAGKVGQSLSDWAVWAVITESAKEIGKRSSGRTICGELARSVALSRFLSRGRVRCAPLLLELRR